MFIKIGLELSSLSLTIGWLRIGLCFDASLRENDNAEKS